MLYHTLLLFIVTLNFSRCSKILGIFPTAVPSHYTLSSILMKSLAEKGHDVTVISPFFERELPKNGSYRNIVLTGFIEKFDYYSKNLNMFEIENISPFLVEIFTSNIGLELTENTLSHNNVLNFLKTNETFDVVIMERFMNEALQGFAVHFNCPLIILNTFSANPWINVLTGNPAPTSYIPYAFLKYSSRMYFWERLTNTLMDFYINCLLKFYLFPQQKQLFDKYFNTDLDFYDVIYNASVVLLNSNIITNQPVPYVPNMINIGGYHLNPTGRLPRKLQEFLDEAKDGVIYFSLGSYLKSTQLSVEKRNVFLKTFSKLKQKVLWKWEADELPNRPRNVKTKKWLPQQDILAHPNIKLFITHGGLLSLTEAIYHKVPLLAIPIYADQKSNSRHIKDEGIGLYLDYQDLSETTLTKKINQMLNNSKFYKNVKIKSKLLRDQLVTPLETAIYWVEYVIRHRGALHLRVAALDLPWFQYYLIDVIAVILISVIITFYTIYKIVKRTSFLMKAKNKKIKQN